MTDSNPIALLDLAAQNHPLLPELRAAFERVVASNGFILGKEVDAFEKEVAAYLGVKHAIGVSSGTDALVVALMALGVGPGDEVITTPFSFFATAGSIARLGATPVFVDIEADTFNLDVSKVERAITPKTKAIMPVHLFGQACDMAALQALAAAHGLPIVEDAAQAIGSRHDLGPVGKLGVFGCFSFFPSKNLGAFGDGGLVTTEDDARAEHLRVLRAHGSKPKYFHAHIGGNFRIDALQAAILRVKLPHLARWTEQRQQNAARYDRWFADAGLPTSLLATPVRRAANHIYNQYTLRTPHRDALRKHLEEQKIGCEIYYPLCLHLQKCFDYLGYREGALPVAERASKEAISIPIYSELAEAQQRRVVDTVVGFLRARAS